MVAASSILPGGRIDVYFDRNRAWLYTNARLRGKQTCPGQNPGCEKSGCSPDRDDVRGKLGFNRDVCAEGKSSVWARPEVCERDDGCFPNRVVVRGKLNLYKTGLCSLFPSMRLVSDWVTSLRISHGRVRGMLAQDTSWIVLMAVSSGGLLCRPTWLR